MTDIVIVLVVLAAVGGAGFYVWKAKKNGRKCIGCPYAGKAGCSCNKK